VKRIAQYIAILILPVLFSGCSTTRYIPTPCPSIKPLPLMPPLHFHITHGQIDRNETVKIVRWKEKMYKHERYYNIETKRLVNFNTRKQK